MIQKREGYKGVEILEEEEDRNSHTDNCGKCISSETNIKDTKATVCLAHTYLAWNKRWGGGVEKLYRPVTE